MGLQEKRMRHNLETDTIPEIKKNLQELVGNDIEINVNWESFTDTNSMQEIQYQILGRIVEAVDTLCRDDFAKSALAESFKAINIKNVNVSDDKSVEFAGSTLNIQANWVDTWNIFTPGDIQSAIENGL